MGLCRGKYRISYLRGTAWLNGWSCGFIVFSYERVVNAHNSIKLLLFETIGIKMEALNTYRSIRRCFFAISSKGRNKTR